MTAADATPQSRVRAAVPADASALSLLGRATFLETYAPLLPVEDILAHADHQHAPSVYARWLDDAASPCWIAEMLPGRAPVGYLVATLPDLPLAGVDERDLEIRRIYLLHRFQGAGLGRQMMDAVSEAARVAGKRRLLLGVYSRNTAALTFYARMGFTEAGTRQFKVGGNTYHDYILQRAP